MNETATRLKIGAVTLVSAILFVLMVLAITRFSLKPVHDVKVYFTFVNSLELRAPVRFAGVRVGDVKNIRVLTPDERQGFQKDPPFVCVVASIDRSVKIPKQSTAMVNTMGFMGEKYLELIPPQSHPGETQALAELAEGENLRGIDPTPMDSVLASAQRLANDMELTINKVNTATVGIQDRLPVLIGELEKTLLTAQDLAGQAKDLAGDAKGLIRTNRENLDHLIANTREITIFMKSFSHIMATRPWKLFWGLGGPIPLEPEDEKISAPSSSSPTKEEPSKGESKN